MITFSVATDLRYPSHVIITSIVKQYSFALAAKLPLLVQLLLPCQLFGTVLAALVLRLLAPLLSFAFREHVRTLLTDQVR